MGFPLKMVIFPIFLIKHGDFPYVSLAFDVS